MTNHLPIGVFDSGMGGLTVLAALRCRLAAESAIYLGDTARLPYGTKSPATVGHYAREAAAALVARGIKALVVADNTSSSTALDVLAASFPDLPIVGVVAPGAAAAAAASRSGDIVVIGTESTIQAGAYARAIHDARPGARVTAIACPLFVAMVEEGMTDGPIAEMAVRHYLGGLFPAHDCLLLACTHFPALAPLLRRVLGPDVAVVDSAEPAAEAVADLLTRRGLAADGRRPSIRYLATDAPDRFARVARVFVPWDITPTAVEIIDLG